MNDKTSWLKPPAGLAGWVMRAGLIAIPSAGWAVAAGFTQPAEIVAMALVVLVYAVVFAQVSACETMNATAGHRRFLRAVKSAVWIKMVALLFAAAYWGAAATVKIPATAGWLLAGVVPDLLGGLVSLSSVAWIAGVREPEALAQLNSFGWTGLATLTQGVLMVLELGLLAVGVLGWWKIREGFTRVQTVD